MNNIEVNKWNYVREDNFHMLQDENYNINVNNEIELDMFFDRENYKFKHHNSSIEKNVYWYGAKIYIISSLDDYCRGGKRNLITRSPELVTGMFMKLADTFHYTDEDYFYPRLYIYEMAADFVQYMKDKK